MKKKFTRLCNNILQMNCSDSHWNYAWISYSYSIKSVKWNNYSSFFIFLSFTFQVKVVKWLQQCGRHNSQQSSPTTLSSTTNTQRHTSHTCTSDSALWRLRVPSGMPQLARGPSNTQHREGAEVGARWSGGTTGPSSNNNLALPCLRPHPHLAIPSLALTDTSFGHSKEDLT